MERECNMTLENQLNLPWSKLPEHIKRWVRNSGYLIRENEAGTSATYLTEWRSAYTKVINNG